MRRTAAWHIDSRSRPSVGKLLSLEGLARQGGHEPVDCQSIFGGDVPVVGSGGVVVVLGSITLGCEFEVWIPLVVLTYSLLLVPQAMNRCTSSSMWKGTGVPTSAPSMLALVPSESSPTSAAHRRPAAEKENWFSSIILCLTRLDFLYLLGAHIILSI